MELIPSMPRGKKHAEGGGRASRVGNKTQAFVFSVTREVKKQSRITRAVETIPRLSGANGQRVAWPSSAANHGETTRDGK
ncbi:hypothetical protein EYF80_047471 [Liparis tanakae]|uniref:Uncharacterized protein n=1 Tax=Liparis tanakae TaxID=230148 RepID=A0A4Z2FNJ3_9TELE|nr:hypothetical protein EYF80_047471 [Liparis tanakae]